MKKEIMIIFFLGAAYSSLAQITFEQKCDCTIYPFTPETCRKYCTSKMLKNSSLGELKLILGLNDGVASKILKADSTKINTLDDYKLVLKKEDYIQLLEGLELGVNKSKVDYYFKTSPADRLKIGKILDKSQTGIF